MYLSPSNTNTHDIRASNLGSKWWKPHTDLDQSGKDRLARVVQEFYEQKLGKELMVDKLISMEQQLPRTSGNSTFRITAALVDKENPEEVSFFCSINICHLLKLICFPSIEIYCSRYIGQWWTQIRSNFSRERSIIPWISNTSC
ncbi:uncharacterized protein LOC141851914 isoform X2 [Brevipalpus obovatus]|uniref:uncharacterized protein LOC141851914 isoform X2 n=1 Tax=Brevipalpus obovatus TaxID=246614 RepID=UPI003D9E27E5